MTIRVPRSIVVALLVAVGIACGGVGGFLIGRGSVGRTAGRVRAAAAMSPDQRLTLWESRQGQDWSLYQAQFFAGFYQGCQDVFLLTDVAGNLTDNSGRQWTVDNCYAARPEIETTSPSNGVPNDPAAAGFANGTNFGCKAIILRSNSDLRGTTVPGKPVHISLGYCDQRYHQDTSGVTLYAPG